MSAGRTWFLHVIYALRSEEGKNRGIGKRSIEYQNLLAGVLEGSKRKKRLASEDDSRVARDIRAIGHDKGTNLQMIMLERPLDEFVEIDSNQNKKTIILKDSGNNIMTIIVIVLVVLLAVLLVVGGLLYKRSRDESGPVLIPNGGTAI